MSRKSAADLANSPVYLGKSQPDPPVNKAISHLTVTEGQALEEMARVFGQEMVNALSIGYIYSEMYGSDYVRGRIDQLLRLSVAKGGQGRRDLIDIVDAGGKLPDAYYSGEGKKTSSFYPADNTEGD